MFATASSPKVIVLKALAEPARTLTYQILPFLVTSLSVENDNCTRASATAAEKNSSRTPPNYSSSPSAKGWTTGRAGSRIASATYPTGEDKPKNNLRTLTGLDQASSSAPTLRMAGSHVTELLSIVGSVFISKGRCISVRSQKTTNESVASFNFGCE